MADFGLRPDGTRKGKGFLGELRRPDGRVSTELSIGIDFDGRERLIPSLVPTLNKDEIDYLLNTQPSPDMWKTSIGNMIMKKAVDHARKRMKEGRSAFVEEEEDIYDKINKKGK